MVNYVIMAALLALQLVCHALHNNLITESTYTMNWLDQIKKQTANNAHWNFNGQDSAGKSIAIEWDSGSILSPQLAACKQKVADFAAHITAQSETQFLRHCPETVEQDMFLRSCAPLFAEGIDTVNWTAVEQTLQKTIKQFYCTDIAKFGEQIIATLIDDIYFWGTATDQGTGKLLGFAMLAITPALEMGSIKLINLMVDRDVQDRGLEPLILGSLFKIIQPKLIFTAVRPTNDSLLKALASCGFTHDINPRQDPNHKLNLDYFMIMEYKTDTTDTLQHLATHIS